ncbi:Uma2 family endonuclease [Streptomyces alboflavus]|uniref:Uma2 family endonuclease n=1 Tax=Streptomyces alboflavus TaxID=67267 RepID=UPI00068F2A76|nr:Uma2 family endonuclease [Streptomyces alboflavus]
MSAQQVEQNMPAATYQRFRGLVEAVEAQADRQGDRVRADIANQEITVHMMSPTTTHGRIVIMISHQVENQDETAATFAETRVDHPELGLCRTADLLVMTQEAYERETEDFAAFAPDVSVAVEVVSSSNPGNDYITKLRDYPRMGVPEYVIVDPRDGTITVHSGPDTTSGEPRYADTPRRYKFGDAVPMGRWTIDTAKFPRYRS